MLFGLHMVVRSSTESWRCVLIVCWGSLYTLMVPFRETLPWDERSELDQDRAPQFFLAMPWI